MRYPRLLTQFATFALAVASTLLLLSSSQAADEPKKGGSLSLSLETDVATLDPLGISSINDRQAAIILYDTLLDIDAKGQIVPGVAEKIETSPDAMSFK